MVQRIKSAIMESLPDPGEAANQDGLLIGVAYSFLEVLIDVRDELHNLNVLAGGPGINVEAVGTTSVEISNAGDITMTSTDVVCVSCGCDEYNACPGGCEWVSDNPPLCSACAPETASTGYPIYGPDGNVLRVVPASGQTA